MGKYVIPTETNLKQYYIKEESFDSVFGPGKVIAPINGTNGINDRFYVMALEDINPGTKYCWYENAVADEDRIVDDSTNDFGAGKENTVYVMNKWKNSSWGPQNNNDIWGVIEDKINEGWFVPTKTEWAAFLVSMRIDYTKFEDYNLEIEYWTSSICDTYRFVDCWCRR